MTFLLSLLRTPDAQSDPHHWAATLFAHALIGVALAAVLPWWGAVLVYAAWEAAQWRLFDAGAWDCLLDLCAVCLGVSVAVALISGGGAIGALLALGVIALAGVRVRG
ncbi:hypothetical protein KLEP181_gp26 [Paracoccus phage vB_PmaP_KLEP18-1]|nr:hypothetical protein KLEP181_gp26 [Paracoccus phage vB_PmaP_KLEP18-1]